MSSSYRRSGTSTPKSLGPAGGIGGSGSCISWSLVMQGCVILAFSMIIFMMGVTVGLQYFDTHAVGPAASLPPGLVAGTAPEAAHIRLRRAEAAAVAASETDKTENGVDETDATTTTTTTTTTTKKTSTESAALPVPPAPENYAVFYGRDTLFFEGAQDALEVSGGAWIYLDSTDRSQSIKTIFSTRESGCAVDDLHRGYTFHVNNWETADQALVLEYRDETGCGRISTDQSTIPLDKWTHVAFAFQGPKDKAAGTSKVMLFVNGKLVKSSPSLRKSADVQISGGRFAVGSTPDRHFFFAGRIAQVFVTRGVISPRQLAATYKLTDGPGMVELVNAAKNRIMTAIVFGRLGDDSGAVTAASAAATEGGLLGLGDAAAIYSSVATKNLVAELTGKSEPRGLSLLSSKAQAAPAQAGTGTTNDNKKNNNDNGEDSTAPAAPRVPPGGTTRKHGRAGSANDKNSKTPASIRRTGIPGRPSGKGFDFTSGANQWISTLIALPPDVASGSVTDPAALAAGTFSDEVTQEQLEASDETGRSRAESVKRAMQHIWRNYKARAWGADELKPRGGNGDQNWGGVGMTLVDSIDTLWVMGMMAEFDDAKEWIRTSLNFEKHGATSVFEITIRELGGLLSAYDLSKDPLFLAKAKDLGDRLLPAFNTPTGIPRAQITLATGWTANPSWTGGSAILSELGTLQVEFRYLSKATGQPHYAQKVENVIEKMEKVRPTNGLYPIYVSTDTGTPTTGTITFGALGDSFYEYLIKVWVQGGRKENMYRRMYDAAADGMTNLLLKRSNPSRLAYVADWDGGGTVDKMDHLVCFVPGMLALGAYTAAGTDGEADAVRDLTNAKALAYTCWQMYERQLTGIAPEFVEFPGGGDLIASPRAPFYILRPEAAESLYILHQLTGNPIYREWGWKMFSAIEKYCKTDYGYGAHPDVRDTGRIPDDRMESFFLAETLKYLYMLQSPDHTISLDKYVFNTEAHPLSIFED